MQSENAAYPMEVTVSGIVMVVRPVQPENTLSLMEYDPLGKVTDVKFVWHENMSLGTGALVVVPDKFIVVI